MTDIQVVEYLDSQGKSLFARWFNTLNAPAAAKAATALYRMERGSFGNCKSAGKGVSEYRIDFGPGYRIYYGRDGDTAVILLLGGSKKRQNSDIKQAQLMWQDYKRRKRK
jgi:putative addiction module killer protein